MRLTGVRNRYLNCGCQCHLIENAVGNMNNTNDSCLVTANVDIALLYAALPVSVVSVITCLVTLTLVCALKLHKKLVYRLAMYQVVSAIEFSILWIVAALYTIAILRFSVTILLFSDHTHQRVVFEALLLGSMVMKVMFTVWIMIHLFALAVYHKNLQRLEPLYVASSLLIPVMVTVVLLAVGVLTKHYMISKYLCLIEDIMYTITFAVLVVMSCLIVTMGAVLCYRAYRRRNLVLSEYEKQHKKALCEMLPLLLYPILFLLLTMPIFGFSVIDLTGNYFLGQKNGFAFIMCAPMWSFSTSLLFIFHLCAVRHIRKRRQKNRPLHGLVEEGVTMNDTTQLIQRSDTHFSSPTED